MSRNIIGMYGDHGIAESVVRDLLDAGVARERMAVAVDEPARRYRALATVSDRRRERNGGKGALIGLIAGVVLGLIIALLAAFGPEPGWVLGPDLTASLVLSAAIGGALGVIIGWLAGAMSRRNVPVPAKHPQRDVLKRSGVVIAADVPNHQASRVARLMERHKPIDLDRRARSWHGQEGWRSLLAPVTAATVLAGRDEARDLEERESESYGPVYDPTVHDRPLGSQRPESARTEGRPRSSLRQYGQEGSRQPRQEEQEDRSRETFASLEPRFRRHFDRHHRERGESWDIHREAYETGVRLAWDGRNKASASFTELENLARLRWESSEHGDVPFRRVRESLVYGFEEGRLSFA